MASFYELDPEKQRRQSFLRLVKYLRHYIEPYHPYLRRLYREQGVDLSRLREPDDLQQLPLLTKSHFRENPQAFILRPAFADAEQIPGYETLPPRRSMLLRYALQALLHVPRDPTDVFRRPSLAQRARRRGEWEWLPIHFHASSGSTGKPTPAVYTFHDLKRVVAELAGTLILPKQLEAGQLYYKLSERGMSLFPGTPHLAFFSTVLAKLAIGTTTFETCGGRVIPTDRQIQLFVDGRFTSLLAIPSYLVHWLRRAIILQQEGSLKPLSTLQHIVLGAEPVSESLRQRLRELAIAAGADRRVQIYETLGMTEMKWWFGECSQFSGLHLNPKYFYWELLDPNTKEPVPEGSPGVLVFSHIGWRGTVLIRYWTGDLVKGGMVWNRCPKCGYTFPRIYGPICRAEKDFTKIKGTLVDLSELIESIRGTPGVRLFQVTLTNEDPQGKLARERFTIHVVCETGCSSAEVEAGLRQRITQSIDVSPDDVLFDLEEAELQRRLFARSEVKAEYLVELRETHI